MSSSSVEIDAGERFGFGENWQKFLSTLSDAQIEEAEHSIKQVINDLHGKRFLDIGSGSGLFSLCAHRLGATVHSFDYDPQSVACTKELKRRYGNTSWTVEQGSALDAGYIAKLGTFDAVYSWGVLHHTGAMYKGLENAASAVKPGGLLWVAIYNDQGRASRTWLKIKRIYNKLPKFLRTPYVLAIVGPRELAALALAAMQFRLRSRLSCYWQGGGRGMGFWVDWVDWIGGLPFEVAKPEEIFAFYRARGFQLEQLRTCAGGWGCNEFVFRKSL